VSRPIRRGQPWGRPATGPADLELAGDDADLAESIARHPGALVRFRPSPESDVARALGLATDPSGTTEVALDGLEVDAPGVGGGTIAVNAVVVGPPPDRLRWTTRNVSITVTIDERPWFESHATTVVVASGQFLRGADLVPRGHPGDGWLEVQVYALARRQRRAMRRRLTTGTHVPHPSIHTTRARHVEIEMSSAAMPLEVDGQERGRVRRLSVSLVAEAIRILI
jgi:hypothetical protein